MTYDRLLAALYSPLWTCTILVLGTFSQNTITSRPSAAFLLSLSLFLSLLVSFFSIRLLLYPSIKWTRFYIEMYMCMCVCVCMSIRRKSYDVLPATGPSWFPLLATALRGVKRRQNATGGGTSGKDREMGRSRNASLVLCLGLIAKSLCLWP